jgi:hypothetical protein
MSHTSPSYNKDALLPISIAARERSLHPKRLRAAIRSGSLPAFQVGAWLRVKLRDVDAWLNGQRYQAPGKGPRGPHDHEASLSDQIANRGHR